MCVLPLNNAFLPPSLSMETHTGKGKTHPGNQERYGTEKGMDLDNMLLSSGRRPRQDPAGREEQNPHQRLGIGGWYTSRLAKSDLWK